MKIAAQLYTLREFLQTPKEIEKTLKKVKKIGYDAVQVSGLGPIDPQELKDIVDKEGLSICATHIAFDRMKKDLEGVIRDHKLWNCKYVGLGSMPGEYRKDKESYIHFTKEASEMARKLKENGLQFVYHNHNFEFRKFGSKTGMDILFEESDLEVFDFELDTYWVQAGGADPVEWIKKVAGRMKVVHFKDMMISSDIEQRFAEIGEGNLNWSRIIEACKEIGVEWCPVEQDLCYDRDPFESLVISYNNLKEMGL
ncbi:sugar phosphate isomerase/epimerase family protein [Natronospora cellulosivora (SeqCode)]